MSRQQLLGVAPKATINLLKVARKHLIGCNPSEFMSSVRQAAKCIDINKRAFSLEHKGKGFDRDVIEGKSRLNEVLGDFGRVFVGRMEEFREKGGLGGGDVVEVRKQETKGGGETEG
jgi:hypothetical protein